ncbi:protein timeless homolog isoform X1 [Capsicum annuum]|uniref:protein timeless homolog isoform X1 n=1 Tax=Capsicum annuum TaxID=4072 RepID=UPI001FB169A4|nr:protein timeless homolog isoform X1 [Capsicum annuum]
MEGLSTICAGLGTIEEDDDGNRIGYTPGKYCLDNLKDLLRFLRRDDPQTREVFKQVCKWNIVGKDLIPIIEYCQDDRNLLLNAVKVMVFLTMPIEPTSSDIPQQIELLWGIKSSVTFSEAVPVIMSLLESPLENLACEAFTEDDWKMVQLVLTLFRNVLAIQDISSQQKSGGSMIEFVFLRDRFLELLFQENVMEVILVLSQQVGGSCSYLRHDNLLLLETFYYIFMGQLPELIAKAPFKDPKADEDSDISINSLRDIMEEEHQKRKAIRQRNLGCFSQFNGTFTRFSLDGSKTLIKGNPCSVSHDPLIIAHTKHRGPAKRTVWDQGRLPATKNKILNLLYDFINQFLGGGYNVLMQSVRDDIEKEHHAIQNSDIVIFFEVAQFVTSFQYNKFLNQPNEVDGQEPMDSGAGSTLFRGCICGPIAESLNISMFQLVLSRWRYSFETLKEMNDRKFLYVAGSLMKTMLLILELVLKQSPEDSKEHRTARILLYKLFYDQTEEGMTHFLLNQIKSFDTHKQAKSYLADLVEIITIVIKLMEKLQERGLLRISKKLRKKRPKTVVTDDKKENGDETIRDSASVGLPVGGSSHESRNTGLEDAIDSNKVDEHTGCTMINEDQMVESTDTTHNNAAGSGSEKSNILHVVGKGEEDITMQDQVNQPASLEAKSNTVPETQQKLSDDVNDEYDHGGDYSSGDENVLTTEDDLKVSALVSTLANNSTIHNLCWLLKYYKSNSIITNNSVINLLQKICEDLELSPMLYQLSLLTTFYEILEEQKSRPCREYENIVFFLTNLVRRMLRKMKSNPLLFIEVLFWKSRRECHYLTCDSMLKELSRFKKDGKNSSGAKMTGEIGSSEANGWTRRSLADALGDDEADFPLNFSEAVRNEAEATNRSNLSLGEGAGSPTSISNDAMNEKQHSEKWKQSAGQEFQREPKRRKLQALNDESRQKLEPLFERYKDSQNCCDLIAEALDPDGKISSLQVTRALKQLGYKIPRKRKTFNKPENKKQVLESEIRLQNSDILEEGTSQRRHLHTRKRVQAFSQEQEQKIKDLFEQFKDHKRCSHMIATALDSEGTLSAAKISRKLKQLGLYVPKKRSLETNLHLMDEASDATTEGSDNSDDETLLSMRSFRSKHQGKGSSSEGRENKKIRKMPSKDASDDELLTSLLVKTKKAVPESKDGKPNINSMKISSENDTEGKDTCDSERGELDQAAAMEVAEFNNIASDVDSDVDAGILAADRSSEQDVPPGDQQLQEKFHSELSDFEDDDASLEAPITTVSRRRLRMVIDVEEDE